MSKIYVTEQASKNKGAFIHTKFSDGSACYHYRNGGYKQYHSAPNKKGLVHALYPDRATKKCALMDALAAKGIE
jgi:hypothetical protein